MIQYLYFENIQLKRLCNNIFPENSILKLMQRFELSCIQFNKIFIQLENPGITQGKQNIGGMV